MLYDTNHKVKMHWKYSHAMVLIGMAILFSFSGISITLAQDDDAFIRDIRTMEPDETGIANPAGLAFSRRANAFHIVEARRQGQTPAETDISQLTPLNDQVGSARIAAQIQDPINMAFDDRFNRLLLFFPPAAQLIEVPENPDGNLRPTRLIRHNVGHLGLQNPQGMAVDPASGHLFVLDSAGPRIVRIEPGPDGRFDNAVVSEVALQQSGLSDLRGLAFDPTSSHLFLLSPAQQELYEVTQTGSLVATRDVSPFTLGDPQGMVFAPSGNLTDDPQATNLYIADSDSGNIVELSSVQPIAAASSTFTSALVQTIDTSQFSPPSPDPSGITYLDFSDTLLISDAEVDEMPIFTGDNLFETDLSGSLVATSTTTAFAEEPVGVALNPINRHLFISDDNRKRIFEINPGSDERYGTSDDIVTSFSTRDFGNTDPEGLAFALGLDALFIADGLNEEIYRVDPGANGRFDGVSPAGDDQVTHFDTTSLGLLDPEGIDFNPDTGNLYAGNRPADTLFEITTGGTLVRTIDVSAARARRLSGLAYGPRSSDPNERSIYIADRRVDNNTDPNENDGKVYEMTLPPLNDVPPVAEVEVQVAASSDDAEEGADGSVARASTALELVFVTGGNQTVGMRFNGITIPQGASITRAYIQFQAKRRTSEATSLTIEGEAADNATTFTSSNGNISSRLRTAADVSWSPVPWTSVGAAGPDQQTPDIASVIQEIVDRSNWSSGNAMVIIITGTGLRVAESYNSSPAGAPLLHIEYEP